MNELAIDDVKFTIRETGIEFRADLSFDEWEQLGNKLARVGKSIGFVIGDWLNYGEKRYGDKYGDAVKRTGLDYGTLRNFAHVARRVDLSLRNDNLDWHHHFVVAKLPAEDQKQWLAAADEHDLSVRRLRMSINKGRVVSIDEMHGDAADRSQTTYMVWINRLCQWWRKRIEGDPIDKWNEEDRATLKRDLQPMVDIYNSLPD